MGRLTIHPVDTPFLWVDVATLEANIKLAAAHFAKSGKAWRPHFKGIKTPAIAHKLLAAGAIGITWRGVKYRIWSMKNDTSI